MTGKANSASNGSWTKWCAGALGGLLLVAVPCLAIAVVTPDVFSSISGKTQSPLTFDAPSATLLKGSLASRATSGPREEADQAKQDAVLLTHWMYRGSSNR